jgi:putative protease
VITQNRPELLSPAGDRACLNAALAGGADAVYLGCPRFSARAAAANFGADALAEAIDTCHERGVRVYIAVNTLIAPEEMEQAVQLLRELYKIGADAAILQDLGLLRRARAELPGFALHASTQMTLHNAAGAKWAARSGISRVIAARECRVDTLREMSEVIETEAFAHGAMCVSVSGQCLFSSAVGCRSGNRGQCAQPCRLPYTWTDHGGRKRSGALISPYDQAQLDNLAALADAGISALKVEGRMKKPEYVYHVTKAYRRALDELAANGRYRADSGTWRTLRRVFDRGGFSVGHAGGGEDASIIYAAVADHEPYARLGPDLVEEAADAKPPAIPVDMRLNARPGEAARLEITDGGHTITVESDRKLESALVPLTDERAAAQLRRTGGTCYAARSVVMETRGAHLPLSMLNQLRAEGLRKLRAARLESSRPVKSDDPARELFAKNNALPSPISPRLIARSQDAGAAPGLLDAGADVFEWAPHDLRVDALDDGLARLPKRSRFVMPEFISDAGLDIVSEWLRLHAERFDGVVVSNPGQLFVKWELPIHADAPIHVFNLDAARLLFDSNCQTVTLSPELTFAQIRRLSTAESPIAYPRQIPEMGGRLVLNAYGRERLMLLSHCPARVALGLRSRRGECAMCDAGSGADGTSLTDRVGAVFPLVRLRSPDECRLRLLNNAPTDQSRAGCFGLGVSLRVTFWDEPPELRAGIVRRFADGMSGKPLPVDIGYVYTTGHARRGV